MTLSVAGTYKFQLSCMGGKDDYADVHAYVKINGEVKYTQAGSFTGYDIWHDVLISGIEFKAGDELIVGFHVSTPTGGAWGDIDDCMLNLVKAA